MLDKRKPSKVPSSRLSRLASFGGLAGSIAGSVIKGTTTQILSGKSPSLTQSLLTQDNALSITNKLAKMRGAAMKIGQLLSMDAGDVLPEAWEPILSRLRQSADPMPKSQLLATLNKAWGDDWYAKFRYFSFEPIAAASIGQVHKATLLDGSELAVKVQYPGVKQSIDSDIDNVISLVKLSGALPKHMNIGPLLEKAKAQLHEEADYRQEAEYIKLYSSLVEDKAQFNIPKVYDELSNEQVLSMSFLSGDPIEAKYPQGDIDWILEQLFQLSLDELFVYRTMQSDPNFANFLFDQSSKRIALLDFGATRQIPKDVSRLYLMLAKAIQSQQTDLIESYLNQLGLIDDNMSSATLDVVIQACLLASECLQTKHYNFKQSQLIKRIQNITQPLIENKDATATPSFDVALINRKITGIVLLANRLGASVNLKSMLEKY